MQKSAEVERLHGELARERAEHAATGERAQTQQAEVARLSTVVKNAENERASLQKVIDGMNTDKENVRLKHEHALEMSKQVREREREELKEALRRAKDKNEGKMLMDMQVASEMQQKLLSAERERSALNSQLETAHRELEGLKANVREKRDQIKQFEAEAMQANEVAFSRSDTVLRQTVDQWQVR